MSALIRERYTHFRREPQRARHLDLARLAFGHHRERRQVAVVVQQQVQLDRALGPPEFGPVEHAHRQVDDAPVEAHQIVFETELLPPAWLRTSSWHFTSIRSNAVW